MSLTGSCFSSESAPKPFNIQSSKMVHAALLPLMLEAVTTDLVSPSA
jgi:hypothetical protein